MSTLVASACNTSGTKGLVTPLKAGAIASGPLPITLSSDILTDIIITPASPLVQAGNTQQPVATGIYASGNTQVLTRSACLTSSSAKTGIATATNKPSKNKGLVKGVSAGSVVITAKMKDSSSRTATLTVDA